MRTQSCFQTRRLCVARINESRKYLHIVDKLSFGNLFFTSAHANDKSLASIFLANSSIRGLARQTLIRSAGEPQQFECGSYKNPSLYFLPFIRCHTFGLNRNDSTLQTCHEQCHDSGCITGECEFTGADFH
jgi:hypothetical protein